MTIKNNVPAIGEVLAQEFLAPMNISQNALAEAIGVAPSRIIDIVNGRLSITADTDLQREEMRYFTGILGKYLDSIGWK